MFSHGNLSNNTSIHHAPEAGFIILTIPVILLLFGFFVTTMINDTKPDQFYFETSTQDHMADVRKTLAAYSHRNYRIPCPGRPNATGGAIGTESGFDGNGHCNIQKGILPFRELGLPESAAKDEWGNYYSYKITSDFARSVSAVNFVEADNIPADAGAEKVFITKAGGDNHMHELCRTSQWLSGNVDAYTTSDGNTATMATMRHLNHNIYKARFCCPSTLDSTGGTSSFSAEDYESTSGQTELDFNESDGTNLAKLGFEDSDYNLAVWDESGDFAQWHREFVSNTMSNNPTFKYSTAYGNSLGPNGAGRYWPFSMTLDINESEVSARGFDIELGDLHDDNFDKPMQISLEVVTADGTLVDTISYVVAVPHASASQGIGELNIHLDQILGDADQDGLFHSGVSSAYPLCGSIVSPSSCDNVADVQSNSENLFNNSKTSLMNALNLKGLEMKDVRIGRLKMNVTHASIAFNGISLYTSPGSTMDDLVILDEDGNARLEERSSDPDIYGSEAKPHDSNNTVSQDFEAVAYVLISHGANGEGSYLVNGSMGKIDNILDANESDRELAHHTEDPAQFRTSYDVRKISSSNTGEYYDDIVLWDSQITLYNALNNATCTSAQSFI